MYVIGYSKRNTKAPHKGPVMEKELPSYDVFIHQIYSILRVIIPETSSHITQGLDDRHEMPSACRKKNELKMETSAETLCSYLRIHGIILLTCCECDLGMDM